MLTQNEKNWLEEREKRPAPCSLNESWNWCLNICIGQTLPLRHPCPMVPDYRDAAEFEARVAMLLAGGESFCPPAEEVHRWEKDSKCAWDILGDMKEVDYPEEKTSAACKWCSIKAARIAVEAEMEAENDR